MNGCRFAFWLFLSFVFRLVLTYLLFFPFFLTKPTSIFSVSIWRLEYQLLLTCFPTVMRTSMIAKIWSEPSRRGSISCARIANSLEPIRSRFWRSFSEIHSNRSTSARVAFIDLIYSIWYVCLLHFLLPFFAYNFVCV